MVVSTADLRDMTHKLILETLEVFVFHRQRKLICFRNKRGHPVFVASSPQELCNKLLTTHGASWSRAGLQQLISSDDDNGEQSNDSGDDDDVDGEDDVEQPSKEELYQQRRDRTLLEVEERSDLRREQEARYAAATRAAAASAPPPLTTREDVKCSGNNLRMLQDRKRQQELKHENQRRRKGKTMGPAHCSNCGAAVYSDLGIESHICFHNGLVVRCKRCGHNGALRPDLVNDGVCLQCK